MISNTNMMISNSNMSYFTIDNLIKQVISKSTISFDAYKDEYIIKFKDEPEIKPEIKKEYQGMNYSTAVFLINKNVRAILTVYEHFSTDAEGKRKAIMHKTMDPSIKVGDYVIVPTQTRHKMTAVKVLAVDVDVDFDSEAHVDWVIGKIDKTGYDALVKQEEQAASTIRAAESQAKRDELKAKLLKLNEDQIKALPIYANGGTTE